MQVYLHYPYCATLCPYCDFFSTTTDEDPAYEATMMNELEWWASWAQGPVTTVYFGGGTPGRMDPRLTARLLDKVDSLWGLASSSEVTLEANPDDITQIGLAEFYQVGINRLSIGVQSLNDHDLKWLGRRHDAQSAIDAVKSARRAGFDNLSLDLIFGLPGQTIDQLADMLFQFFSLNSEHVSLYGLTIEPGTHFGAEQAAGRLNELDRNEWLSMYELVARQAQDSGFHRYEISNFAKPGLSGRHNRSYWRDRNFIGVGPGAHGQRQLGHGGLERRLNPKSLRGWRQKVEASLDCEMFLQAGDEQLSPAEWLREAVMLGIRDLDLGIDPLGWGRGLGLADSKLMATVQRLIDESILTPTIPHRLQPQGILRVDEIAAKLLND